jgi:hypothetical protein
MGLLDLYKRYMYGQSPAGTTDVMTTEGTRGLFGQGGQSGDGLLNTFTKPETDGLFNALSNPFYTIGGSAVLKGMQGENISKAIMPSIKEGLSLSESSKKIQAAKKKQDLIKKYSKEVPKEDMEIFLISPENYIQAKLKSRLSTPTLSKEVLAVYNKLKGLSGEAYTQAKNNLSDAEKKLYQNKIEGNEDFLNQLVSQGLEQINTPVILDSMPEKKLLKKGQLYNVSGKGYRWDGKEMIPAPLRK